MRKTFHALSPLHFLMGKCTAGVKCSLDITSKNIVSSTERKSTESAKDLLKTNVLGPWLHQDNSKELVISKYTWWRNSLRTSSVAVCRGIKSCQRQAGLLPAQTIQSLNSTKLTASNHQIEPQSNRFFVFLQFQRYWSGRFHSYSVMLLLMVLLRAAIIFGIPNNFFFANKL